jgi:drug/metabolite transporter (DMT)-like permease
MVLYDQSQSRKKRNYHTSATKGSSIMMMMMLQWNHWMATITSPRIVTPLMAMIYVLSGICQPLLMTVCKHAGLADSTAQLYMLFYYLGPTLVLFPTLLAVQRNGSVSTTVIVKASMVAIFDIIAQTFNYTGASDAGATIFAMIYSSVTIWTALFSRCLLQRKITYVQCLAILIVFGGLCITSLDSISLGPDVVRGTIYILIGSCMHGATYVFSEAIMMTSHGQPQDTTSTNNIVTNIVTPNKDNDAHYCDRPPSPPSTRHRLTYTENSGIQGMVACIGLLIWQIIYTIPRWDELIRQPTLRAGTTLLQAIGILLAFSLANLFHSVSFYYTVAHYPGGATSAGIMKGLQAVLVFIAAHYIYCNRNNNNNDTTMCFTTTKFISLITVVGGVVTFRWGGSGSMNKAGYTTIQCDDRREIHSLSC